jgi:hypothetical protein
LYNTEHIGMNSIKADFCNGFAFCLLARKNQNLKHYFHDFHPVKEWWIHLSLICPFLIGPYFCRCVYL